MQYARRVDLMKLKLYESIAKTLHDMHHSSSILIPAIENEMKHLRSCTNDTYPFGYSPAQQFE